MLRIRLSTLLFAPSLLAAALATACAQGDVGAPCNHGTIEPPSTRLVTFPALSCNDLLCVYGEEQLIPIDSCNPSDVTACNENNPGEKIFECVQNSMGNGVCRLSLEYVLDRSMCSKSCEDDNDCNNTGVGNRPAVDDDETSCESEFQCVAIQTLGEFCCKRLCVCADELPDLTDIEEDCPFGEESDICKEDEEGA